MKHQNRLIRWFKGFMFKNTYGMISCREFEDFILDYLDDNLPAQQRSRFERHIRICRECQQYLQGYQRTLEISQAAFSAPDAKLPDEVPEDLIKAILKARDH